MKDVDYLRKAKQAQENYKKIIFELFQRTFAEEEKLHRVCGFIPKHRDGCENGSYQVIWSADIEDSVKQAWGDLLTSAFGHSWLIFKGESMSFQVIENFEVGC